MNTPLILPADLESALRNPRCFPTPWGYITIGHKPSIAYRKVVINVEHPEQGYLLANIYDLVDEGYSKSIRGVPVWISNFNRYGCLLENESGLRLYADAALSWTDLETNFVRYIFAEETDFDHQAFTVPFTDDVRAFVLTTREMNFIFELAYENTDIELPKYATEGLLSLIPSFELTLMPPYHQKLVDIYEAIMLFKINQTGLLLRSTRRKKEHDRQHLENTIVFLNDQLVTIKFVVETKKGHSSTLYEAYLLLVAFCNHTKRYHQAMAIASAWTDLQPYRKPSATDALIALEIQKTKDGLAHGKKALASSGAIPPAGN